MPVDSMDKMEEESGLNLPDDSAASPDEHLLREDERRTVQKVVVELPEKYRLSGTYVLNCTRVKCWPSWANPVAVKVCSAKPL